MRMRGLLVYGVVLLASSPLSAQNYQIRLSRDAKAGEKFELSASGSESEQLTMSTQGKVFKTENSFLDAKLDGTITVLEVDELMRESKLSLLVSRCMSSIDGNFNEQEALPEGTQVVAQLRDGKTEFLVDGNAATEEIAKILNLFIDLSHLAITDDDIFGTKESRTVGESWPINSALAAKGFTREAALRGLIVDKENIKGYTKIDKMVEVDGTKCLEINATMEMNNFALPLPSGLAIERSNIAGTFSGTYPVNVSMRSLSDGSKITMMLVAKGKLAPDSPEITLSINEEQSIQKKETPLK